VQERLVVLFDHVEDAEDLVDGRVGLVSGHQDVQQLQTDGLDLELEHRLVC
jgi:hypothetical protein